MTYQPIHRCRSCGGSDLFTVIDLGQQPLANALRAPGDDTIEARYPLAVVACGTCSLVQLNGTVDPHVLFDTYPYFSSFSPSFVDAMKHLAERVIRDRQLKPADTVVEIASNDGYLLQHYARSGVGVLGIEPAKNIAAIAEKSGIRTVCRYFSLDVAAELREDRGAAVIHANNVLAHIPTVNDVFAGISYLLADDGVAIVETPYLLRMIDGREFDTIYHEHVFYYSLTALRALATRHGLVVVDVEEVAFHGGSLRVWLAHSGSASARVTEMLAREDEVEVRRPGYYDNFSDDVAALGRDLWALLTEARRKGAVAAYGAAAKGTVLLNHFGIGRDVITYVVDRSPHKQGLLMPGVGIPVEPVERLADDVPPHTLLLAWNFSDEVVEQQERYRRAGGRFIVPLPELRTI